MKTKDKSCMSRILMGVGILFGLCLLLSVLSVLSNRNLPQQDKSEMPSSLDKARLLEALQVKSTLGDQVWPGWGDTDMPVILSNSSREFLFNYPGEPPADWSLITNDQFDGNPYYRHDAKDHQNFAVKVGEDWTASMATKNTTDIFLIDAFRDMFPTPIKQIFPYRFLIQPSETQIGGLLHETFHVLQYQIAPARITKAESIHKLGDEYEKATAESNSELKKESALLADALGAKTREDKISLVREFLAVRDARREDNKLGSELIDYERWLEWEEGTAKYIEVASLKAASESKDYIPVPEMQSDSDFKSYKIFNQRWSQELFQLRYQTTSGETQFYMIGMAEAFLLDDFLPNWKEKYWEEDTFLEDLLREAVQSMNSTK
jgi:hypothetical protein